MVHRLGVAAAWLAMGLALPADAYVLLGAKWQDVNWSLYQCAYPPGPVVPVDANPVGTNLSGDAFWAAVVEAVNVVNAQNGTSFRFVLRNRITETGPPPPASCHVRITVAAFGAAGSCANAVCNPYDAPLGIITNSGVNISTGYRWGPADCVGSTNTDLVSVLLHELGHAAGLNHSGGSAMMAGPANCGAPRRLLNGDDQAAFLALYGRARYPYRVGVQ